MIQKKEQVESVCQMIIPSAIGPIRSTSMATKQELKNSGYKLSSKDNGSSQSGMSIDTTGRTNFGSSSLALDFP